MKCAVDRGVDWRPAQYPEHIGMDETSFQMRHEYVTLVVDQGRAGGRYRMWRMAKGLRRLSRF